jgi:curved DNA-binding protein CbpA
MDREVYVMRKHYQTLGIDSDATQEEIKKSYREKSQQMHPDKGGDHQEFVQVTEAYRVLSSPERRKRYDETGDSEGPDINGKAMELALRWFTEAIRNPFEDVLDYIQERTETAIEESNASIRAHKQELEGIAVAESRIKARPEADFLGEYFKSVRSGIERGIDEEREKIAMYQKIPEFFDGYEFYRKPTYQEQLRYVLNQDIDHYVST